MSINYVQKLENLNMPHNIIINLFLEFIIYGYLLKKGSVYLKAYNEIVTKPIIDNHNNDSSDILTLLIDAKHLL